MTQNTTDPLDYARIHDVAEQAFLKAAAQMGGDLRKLSWFWVNRVKIFEVGER
jgi:hypothetical protein